MAETTNLNIRIDKDLKERAEAVFADMGMSMTTAFNIFVRQPCGRAKSPLRFTQTRFKRQQHAGIGQQHQAGRTG